MVSKGRRFSAEIIESIALQYGNQSNYLGTFR